MDEGAPGGYAKTPDERRQLGDLMLSYSPAIHHSSTSISATGNLHQRNLGTRRPHQSEFGFGLVCEQGL
jgi:hypothetical protein